jgi:hypothetical protein
MPLLLFGEQQGGLRCGHALWRESGGGTALQAGLCQPGEFSSRPEYAQQQN